MRPRLNWASLLIILGIVGFVGSPIWLPREIAKWYLAAAANAFRLNDRAQGERLLSRALTWNSQIDKDGDFWIAQIAQSQNSDERLELLEKAAHIDSRIARQGRLLANSFIEERDFQRAVRALKLALPNGKPENPIDRNDLAYYRALAGVELDAALADIDQAILDLGQDPNVLAGKSSFLDTKAWVLHGMRRNLEALPIVREAIALMEASTGQQPANPATRDEEAIVDPTDPADVDSNADGDMREKVAAAKRRINSRETWTVAVLRFHHLKILEALRQTADAQRERAWFRERGIPISDELF